MTDTRFAIHTLKVCLEDGTIRVYRRSGHASHFSRPQTAPSFGRALRAAYGAKIRKMNHYRMELTASILPPEEKHDT